jgi:CRP-like cAMP-binding protein
MTGLPVLLGSDRSPHQTFMQIEGSGVAIGARDLQRLLATRSSLAAHLLRFARVFAVQLAQTALANTKGKLAERLARWLLMAHDRLPGDAVHHTHEFLALMLGTRRAGVTTALNNFEAKTLIASARGRISILDRAGLMSIAGGLYGVPEREFEELFPSRVRCLGSGFPPNAMRSVTP